MESITIYKNDGSIDGIFKACGDVYDYLQKRKNSTTEIQKITEKKLVVIIDLIISEDVAEEKINNALSLFGIDNMRESKYWIILMNLLKETIDPNEYIKWWTEAMCEYRKRGEKAKTLITVSDNNDEHIIENSSDLYMLLGEI